MSGGFMDYVCYRVSEEADKIGDREIIALCKDVASLMHDRKWFLSGDYDESAWKKSLSGFKKKWFKELRSSHLASLVEEVFTEARDECMNMIREDV